MSWSEIVSECSLVASLASLAFLFLFPVVTFLSRLPGISDSTGCGSGYNCYEDVHMTGIHLQVRQEQRFCTA